ncbi:polyprenyl synthetase family protein [Prevotella sp. P2-180]|uniref:polyprenyl synthetase family protein n=1 Tax=Prevotella sp. P2-180 TaxID=2024224 RepID=UPI000B96C7A8|nr:polyprenyl synthetase family protein [Prevotella sp. P2-180]OYP62927.1 octaprenyl-diphosphate synthase [Prevotella sp. P2-180]
MERLSIIKRPIDGEFDDFVRLFNESLSHTEGLLSQVLEHIKHRGGKRMRPLLILLIAKNYGGVNDVTLRSAVGLELLHTASLVHDDVVDESKERRGQPSVNAVYNNKVAVLVGDYVLSTALLNISYTNNSDILRSIAELGRNLSNGEILQLSNIQNTEFSEDIYYDVIKMKTAALFEACCEVGTLSVNANDSQIELAKEFGRNLGIIFQIRDDIFDYYDSKEIGKPTGNDMAEGKLTLPVLYALNSTHDSEMEEIARKVKRNDVTRYEIARLVDFTKNNGGIEYAERKMLELRQKCMEFIDSESVSEEIRTSLTAYIDYVIQRNK